MPFLAFSLINAVVFIHFRLTNFNEVVVNCLVGLGVGPQMYFLTFLFAFTGIGAIIQAGSGISRQTEAAICGFLLALLIVVALNLPTEGVTGGIYRLLPLYGVAFIAGHLIAILRKCGETHKMPVALALVMLFFAIGLWDSRFYYICFGTLIFQVSYVLSSRLPNRRIPGSGGVYLIHAPIVNVAMAHGLSKLGINGGDNFIFGVLLIYGLCLGTTRVFIKALPRYRNLLLE
jgi:hypothetical protein